jgi:hypothetical protein
MLDFHITELMIEYFYIFPSIGKTQVIDFSI